MIHLKKFNLFESIGKLKLDPSEYNIVMLQGQQGDESGQGSSGPQPKNIEDVESGLEKKPGEEGKEKGTQGQDQGENGDKKGDSGQQNLIGKKVRITEGPEKGKIGIIKQVLPNGDIIIE
jgi:hypothetical protein